MATNGYIQTNTEYDSYFFVRWDRTGTWNNQNSCGSTIYWEAGVYCGHSFQSNAIRLDEIVINGTQVFDGATYSYLGVGEHVLSSGTLDIPHENDGTKTFQINGFSAWLYAKHNYWADSESFTLDTIPRYPTGCAISFNSKTIDSIKINWSANQNCSQVQYRLNGGSWVNTLPAGSSQSSGSFNITGLSPNTQYTIECDFQRADSGMWSSHDSPPNIPKTIQTTYDIGKIASVGNFNHGDDALFEITNPSGASLSMEMSIDSELIATKTVYAGSDQYMSFTQEQLDKIYKLYGSSNTLTAIFVLKTGTYTDTKTATITLTGKQLTAHVKEGRAQVYVVVNNSTKRAVVWIGNNGNRRCI